MVFKIETAVLPASKKLHAFWRDRLALEHHFERPLTEELLHGIEVEIVGSGVKLPLLVENSE